MIFDFDGCLAHTMGAQQGTDLETIRTLLLGCEDVVKTDLDTDKTGVDYVARLRKGRLVAIDAKTRKRGASRFWNGQPDLALEVWSVMPGGKFQVPKENAKTGWTLSESGQAELILYTFDLADTDKVYLMPFQHLRMAFRKNFKTWMERYKVDVQESHRGKSAWQSQAVFVPASDVWDAVIDAGCGKLVVPDEQPILTNPQDAPTVQRSLFEM